mgnify:FL=1
MEFVWRPNESKDTEDPLQIFTHVLYNGYSNPPGMDFDIVAGDPLWVNDRSSLGFNADVKSQQLDQFLSEKAEHYVTDDMIVLFGQDFRFMDAEYYYQSMDAMIEYMNLNYANKYNFIYSTPSNYIDALVKHNVTWTTKYDDMFPYSDVPDGFWSGYSTSRPNLKQQVRSLSSNFHASAQIYSLSVLDQEMTKQSFD